MKFDAVHSHEWFVIIKKHRSAVMSCSKALMHDTSLRDFNKL